MYPVSSTLFPVRRHLALLLLATGSIAFPQTVNRNLILLDPAHGGSDLGTSFNGTLEKDLALSLAATVRTLLTARNFNVTATRDADLTVAADQRAATANHLRPAACLLLHASASGNGIHIVTSSLPPSDTAVNPVPWETAQATHLVQSRALANTLGLAMLRARLPVTLTPAALRPLDNLTCPAVAIEIAPLANGSRSTSPTDPGYQRRLAEAIAYALTDWRNALPTAGAAQ